VKEGAPGSLSVLAERYELREVIGSGGMATVWLGFDTRLRREVAIKVLSSQLAEDSAFKRRFEREARHIAALSDPNVVTVFDFGVDDGSPYIVMELIRGQSLRQVLDSSDRLPVASTAHVARDVLAGLSHAHHRGIVHRDIKPGNILISSSGLAKIADFGIARESGDTTEIPNQALFAGTIAYTSPEQVSGSTVGPASDLYSLACVLYECLAGVPPFDEDISKAALQHQFADPQPIETRSPDVPAVMAATVMRALQKIPGDRFGSADEMRDSFAGFDEHESRWIPPLEPPRASPQGDRLSSTRPDATSETEDGRVATQVVCVAVGKAAGRVGGRKFRRPRAAVIASAVVGLAIAGTLSLVLLSHNGARPGQTSPIQGTQLSPGGILNPGQALLSPNGKFELAMQADGDLVGDQRSTRTPTWATATSGNPDAYVIMQGDGNVVVYPKGKSAPQPGLPTAALWQSATNGNPGAVLAVLDDGNIVIRSHGGNTVLWQTGSIPGKVGSEMLSGDQLHPGQYLESPNGAFRLANEASLGVLRLYATDRPLCSLWQEPPRGRSASVATMQSDGNWVLNPPGTGDATWQSNTHGNGASLVIENDGTLVLSSQLGVLLWQVSAVSPASSASACHS